VFFKGAYFNNNLISSEQVFYRTTYHSKFFYNLKSLLTLFISPLFARYSDEFAITNIRIIMKTGLIARRTLELNLSKVESVLVCQSVFGRILGFGDVIFIETGETRETFIDIRKSSEFRNKFQETI
jgi:uncharacterized membrane protein YdbT with pleckstrin-like domain